MALAPDRLGKVVGATQPVGGTGGLAMGSAGLCRRSTAGSCQNNPLESKYLPDTKDLVKLYARDVTVFEGEPEHLLTVAVVGLRVVLVQGT